MRYPLLAAVLLSASLYAAEERTWVSVEFTHDGKDKVVSVYGSVLRKDLDAAVSGEKKAFLLVSHIFWFDGPRIVRQVDQGGFAGISAYRLDTVLRITILSEDYVAKIMPEIMAPPKGGQLPEKPVLPPKADF